MAQPPLVERPPYPLPTGTTTDWKTDDPLPRQVSRFYLFIYLFIYFFAGIQLSRDSMMYAFNDGIKKRENRAL